MRHLGTISLPTLGALLAEVLNPQGEVQLSPDGVTPNQLVTDHPDTTDPDFCKNNPTHTSCKSADIDLTAPPAEQPTLENTPTAKSILDPLLNLLPSYRNVTISHVAGVCPTVTFNTEFGEAGGAYYRAWLIDQHCTMFEDFRGTIGSIFMVLFAFAAFRIVMKA
jgi:hypothetical protein